MINGTGYAADTATSRLQPRTFQCDDPGARNLQIKIMFCGVCHSDIQQVKNEGDNTVYPACRATRSSAERSG